ncbi:MAG TPA: DNA-processing protein DprA [Puia sp.]
MEKELLYRLALTRIAGIGPVYAKKLFRHFGAATPVFQADPQTLIKAGLPLKLASSPLSFPDLPSLEKEQLLLHRRGIRSLFFTDPDYPQRLLPYEEAPALLFYKGNADLNAPRILAIVGTRQPTEYGRQVTATLIRDLSLALPGLVIISGLAMGIDGTAHRAALAGGLPTVGILGHGFAHLYPPEHGGLARNMENQGGLLTGFPYPIGPEIHHFPLRNRIVAGISDALVVIETALQGGSLGAVDRALAYRKNIFAIPGRLTDKKSAGCNDLIRTGHARLLTNAEQLRTTMNWDDTTATAKQPSLFPPALPGLKRSEQALFELLQEKESASLDELADETHLDIPSIATALLTLELKGAITPLPGRRYRLKER